MPKKPKITKPGRVQKVVKPLYPGMKEKAEIAVEGADDLYREIRIDNCLEDEKGRDVKLKEGAEVEVTVEADPEDTVPKPGNEIPEGVKKAGKPRNAAGRGTGSQA